MKTKPFLKNIIMTAILVTGTAAVAATTETMDPAQQKQIEGVVRNYLVKNPEVIVESLQTLQQKQMQEAKKTMEKTQLNAPKYVDALFHRASDPTAGNMNGTVTIVEFFDYQCPHCVDMTPVIEGIIKNNPNVRVVFKEFPIRGPLSEFASRAALAAKLQGKYFEFHKGLMDLKQEPLTQDSILKVAKTTGLNVDKLTTDMKSAAISQQIKHTQQLAQDLKLMGTPALFIARSNVSPNASATEIAFIPGQVAQEQLQEVITKLK